MTSIFDGKILNDVTFELNQHGSNGQIIKVKYSGVWNLVDNGYLPWSTCIPPVKHPTEYDEQRFAKWAESMRKDVECCFGIIKGRFRILKSPICLFNINSVDMIWKTCCALHNWLLEIDGLDKEVTDGIDAPTSEWEGELGQFVADWEVPLPVQRLLLPTAQYI